MTDLVREGGTEERAGWADANAADVSQSQRGARLAAAGLTAVARHTARVIADFLVPPVCVACRTRTAAHNTLCPSCWQGVDFIRAPICDKLGIPLPFDAGPGTVSAAALAAAPAYDRARSVAAHTDVMRQLVHALKYGDRTDGLVIYGRWLALAAADLLDETDVIVPVPLNRWRLLARRFNQAALLAHALGSETGKSVDPLALTRIRRTRSQVGLTANQRRRNVSGAFNVPPERSHVIAGRGVLLVDDVLTTGATLDAATRTLRRAGAVRVNVVTLARVVAPVQPTV